MIKVFGETLKKMREDRYATQQEILELLIRSDDSLSKLDLTTYSRWERGVTVPKLFKQLVVVRILGGDITHLIDPKARGTQKKQKTFANLVRQLHNPYIGDFETFTYNECKSRQDRENLCRQLTNFHQEYLGESIDTNFIVESDLLLNAFRDTSHNLIGHNVYGFVSVDTREDLFSPSKLTEVQFININKVKDQALDLYIVSAYHMLPTTRMIELLFLLDILVKRTKLKSVIINCHNQDAYNLYSTNIDFQVLSKGDEVQFGGVKMFTKCYQYVQIKLKAEAILASKVISHLVPSIDKYILEYRERFLS
ncbi:Transcriptional regulator [Vibrio chagasii]|uniref:helix-turn-helix domain-containing protein n=1 Tax=Vibrio TaxID=662 RepID=UPI000E32CD02|nr:MULTISPECIES: helix-turn-helix domain-containing protein [Vibrio]MCG9673664.1 helix-turn-helix domain-containing protein [Vibrio chagasii]CAH6938268.1 Transcriptional regulator [Vibrio chagasii]CAH6954900.1 Transcriptional regulator [Vibrio chagasii]CAH6988927.1 Transcriptional regulator [Vibrio chagasii]CAH7002733.1 Transcriptional regulator [Vibrio chagasii]